MNSQRLYFLLTTISLYFLNGLFYFPFLEQTINDYQFLRFEDGNLKLASQQYRALPDSKDVQAGLTTFDKD